MNPELESFGHLMIARTTGKQPVRLARSPKELTFLAFDATIQRLVELHVLGQGKALDASTRQLVQRRARELSLFRGPSFSRVLDVGEDSGITYYTSNLNDGEYVSDYVKRIGPPPPALVFALVHQLLEDVIRLKDQQDAVPTLHLDQALITTQEDAFLQLRLYDLGLTDKETEEQGAARLVIEGCRLIFQLLTGRTHQGENPDLFPALTAVPMNLRTTMRAALADSSQAPLSLEKLKDDVREAHAALVSNIQARTSRRQLLVTPALQPKSQIQDVLLEKVPVETMLGGRFLVVEDENFRRQPFSIPCINAKNEQPVTVHLLPPSRIVDKALYEAVPLQMWRFDAEKHPNILRSLSLWESPDWTFLTEEREPGFSLSRLLAERVSLNPAEVLVLLRQVQSGQDQAHECGVQRLDLHPSSIFLRVGRNGPTQARENERLMQKRVDVWPPFHVKLRAHLTLRNLYEPPLVDKPEHGEHPESHLASKDYRHRVFIGLAIYLLTGERQSGGQPVFPESVPETLASYLIECLEKSRQHGAAPAPTEFLQQFEEAMNGPAAPDLLTRMRGAMVNPEEMESAGSVSDFDDDEDSSAYEEDLSPGDIAKLKPVAFTRKSSRRRNSFPWIEWAAGLSLAAIIAWLFIPSGSKDEPVAEAAPTQAKAPEPEPETPAAPAAAQSAKVEPPPPPPATTSPEPPMPSEAEPTAVAQALNPPQNTEAKLPQTAPPAPASAEEPPPPPPSEIAAPTAPPKVTAASTPSAEPAPAAESTPPEAKPAGPKMAKPVPNPVIIRKAIVPTPEEIAKFKQGLNSPKPASPALPDGPETPDSEEPQIGTMPPGQNLAQP